jgi:phage baseplate assembly protein W
MSEILGTGLSFPLAVDSNGRVALVSDVVDIDQAIKLIIGTAPGERPMRPDFGCKVHDMVFERVDASTAAQIEDAVRDALDRWEPRIVIEEIGFDLHDTVLNISIAYRVRATNAKRNLVYPFYVVPEEEE